MKYKLFILFSFCFSFTFSQGTWTWMKGSNTINPNGVYGTQGLAAPTNVPPALYEACEWTDLNGNFWLFGGADVSGGALSALWKYDVSTNMWTWMKGPSAANQGGVYGVKGMPAPTNYPGSTNVGMHSWVDQQGNLWMLGGQGTNGNGQFGFLCDMWKYDISTNEWTWMFGNNNTNDPGTYGTKGLSAPTNIPPARAESACAWTDNNNNLWLFGGLNRNDLWKFNIATNQWTWMKGSTVQGDPGNYGTKGVAAITNEPQARDAYARWKDKNGNLWMMGGQLWPFGNDMWKYDVTTNMWTWMHGSNIHGTIPSTATLCARSANDDPHGRWENRACWTDTCGNFWMFSGGTTTTTFPNDLWHYNVQSNIWTLVNAPGAASYGTINIPNATNKPPGRIGALPFTDTQGNLWVFGGWDLSSSGKFNDLWKYVIDTSCAGGCGPPSTNVNANFTASNISGCANLTVNFTNTSSNSTSWNWNFGDGNTSTQQNPSNTYNNPGQYTVTLIASNGTQFDTTTQINYVTVYANAIANYTSSADTLCVNDSVNFTNLSSNANAYQWNFGNGNTTAATNPSTTYNTSGTFAVTLIAQNANGCNDTIAKTILVKPASIFSQTISICNGDDYILPGGDTVNTAGNYIDTLNAKNNCDSIITTILSIVNAFTISQNGVICNGDDYILPGGDTVTSAGIYIDTINSISNCDSIITTTLIVNQNTTSTITQSICVGNSYTLPNGTVLTSSGTYTSTITNSKGCDSIITTIVIVNPLPTANVSTNNDTITQGESITLIATGGGTYSWNPPTTPNNTDSVFASPIVTTTYCVIVTDNNGCKDTACITIHVKEIPCPQENNLALPNAFSPNNDNVNDEYCLQGWVPCVENFEIKIYNRWGEKVYESKDPNFCWDGKYKEKTMDSQVFVYYLKAKFINMDKPIVKQGNITLIK